ncbi:Xylosyltransferase family GT14 [Gracilaria domingensis]|nr:Xylosyltransferase family GT14 [Gracilaria domingensis]
MSDKRLADTLAFQCRQRRSLRVLAVVFLAFLWCTTYVSTSKNSLPSVLRAGSVFIPKRGVKLALFIQAYDRTLPLLPSLLDAIWHPENIYAIHIDKRTHPDLIKPLERLLSNANYSSNVHLIPRQYVTYLGITTVLNTLNAISFLLEKDANWDYFINLSAADYPLVTATQLRDILGQRDVLGRELSFVQTTNYSNAASGKVYDARFGRLFVDTATYSVIRPHDPYEEKVKEDPCIRGCLKSAAPAVHPLHEDNAPVKIVKSEAWIMLHRTAAEFALKSGLSRQLIAFFANVHCPEEFFFSTLLTHAEETRDRIVHDAFRLVLWGVFKKKSRPPAIDSGDIPNMKELIRDKGGLFVRKRMKTDSDMRSYIDDRLLGISREAQRDEKMRKSSHMFSRRQNMRVTCAIRHRVGESAELNRASYRRCMEDTWKATPLDEY